MAFDVDPIEVEHRLEQVVVDGVADAGLDDDALLAHRTSLALDLVGKRVRKLRSGPRSQVWVLCRTPTGTPAAGVGLLPGADARGDLSGRRVSEVRHGSAEYLTQRRSATSDS
jgi:hypothetical protein